MVTTRSQKGSKRSFDKVDNGDRSEQKPGKKQNVTVRSSHMEKQDQPTTDEDDLDDVLSMINGLFGDNDKFDDGLFAQFDDANDEFDDANDELDKLFAKLDDYKWDPDKGVLVQYKQKYLFEYFGSLIQRLSNKVMSVVFAQQ